MLSITELIRRSRHSRVCTYTQNTSVCGLLGADKKGQCCSLATIQATAARGFFLRCVRIRMNYFVKRTRMNCTSRHAVSQCGFTLGVCVCVWECVAVRQAMITSWRLIAALAAATAKSTAVEDAPIFTLECGEADGVWLPPMAAACGAPPPPPSPRVAGLLGVPYAEPPLGREGRWKPPRQGACWR